MIRYTAKRIALEVMESDDALPPLPAASQRLLLMARQPVDQIDIPAFSKIVEGDPALTAKLLQLANSSYFGTLKEIMSVRQAIMHMGLEETITSVYSIFFREALPEFPKLEGFSGKDYWDHCWACATANRMLGHPVHQQMAQAIPCELYIAGLLHGVGKIFLAINRTEQFQQCLHDSREQKQPLAQSEVNIIGTTDTEIAYYVLKNWNLPEHICQTIRHYQAPSEAAKEYRGAAALTQLAYYISSTSGIGNNGDGCEYDVKQSYVAENWALLRTEKKHQELLIKDIFATLKKKSALLNPETEKDDNQTDPMVDGTEAAKIATQKSRKEKGLLSRLFSW